jgi:hypothetical protein
LTKKNEAIYNVEDLDSKNDKAEQNDKEFLSQNLSISKLALISYLRS